MGEDYNIDRLQSLFSAVLRWIDKSIWLTIHTKVCILYLLSKTRIIVDENPSFEWDDNKNELNQKKHNISFKEAQFAFSDPKRIIAKDLDHSGSEERYYCFGKIREAIVTVRFTYRKNTIRIIGAGYWRKGKQVYEKENKIQ